jgi:hypothetical protein
LIQKKQNEAKKQYQPNGQGCQFDTTARYMAQSAAVSKAMTTGYSVDFNKVGNNKSGSPGAAGPAALQKTRWETYKTKFCDGDSNNGKAGCATGNALANAHVLPSKTIFDKETIDMTDADVREAVNQLMFNITDYEASDPILAKSQKSASGLQQRRENREYLAQMDAVGALAYSVIAERVPGKVAAEIQELRQKMGIQQPSAHPSAREIRQSVVEQLWDPGYYKALYDGPSTISQKEIYLKAYSLVLLYNMIEKQEKISNVYAIETANMLDAFDKSRHNVSSSAPVQESGP